MFYRVFGAIGSGKKEVLLNLAKKAYQNGEKVFWIVPEQASAGYERLLTQELGPGVSTLVEVCNFSRLSNVVLRSYGKLAQRSVTEEEKKLLLFRTLSEKKDALRHFSFRRDPESVDAIYHELEEARLAGLDADALRDLIRQDFLQEDLKEKLVELYWVQESFDKAIQEKFSDPLEEEMRLAGILQEYNFFSGSTVLLDGFWDFTAPQEALIRRFLSQAKTVAISFVGTKKETVLFEKTLRCARRLLRFAREAGVEVEDITVEEEPDASPLGFLKAHMADGIGTFRGEVKALSLTSCPTPSDQASFVAETILKKVKEGARWKDFAILSRTNGDQERMILTLQEAGIPVFAEEKKSLETSPLATTLLLGTRIASLYAKEDVVREYLKCGLILSPQEDLFLLEKYIATWSLSGRALLDGKDFVMNPEGYFALDSVQTQELERVNAAKKHVFDPLRRLSFALSAGTNEEKVTSLVSFLVEIGAEKLLHDQISASQKKGRFEEAGELVRMWNCVLERLSGIGRTCGQKEDTAEGFFALLTLALSGDLPGSVPPGQDQVLLSQLSFARPEEAKYVFLTDLNAGVFPEIPAKGTLFSEEDREALSDCGYLFSFGDRAQNEELFYFYLATGFAKSEFFLSYLTGSDGQGGQGSLSVFGKRVKSLFPDLKEREYRKENAMPRTRHDAFSYLLSHAGKEDALSRKLVEYFSETKEDRARLLSALSGKVYGGDHAFLSEEKPYENRDISMTYSRLETYSRCRFSYFSRYLLEARAQGKARFGANITGSFVHRVLETVLALLREEKRQLKDLTASELAARNMRACAAAVSEIMGDQPISPEIRIRLRQVERSTLLILKNLQKEFSVSSFEPVFFEKELTDLGGAYQLPLPDGTRLCLYGTIDRVDRFTDADGKEYIRVVDYKTGSQTFRLEDVANGLDLQMLLYLFALWGRPLTPESRHGALPAGILYLSGMGSSVLCENTSDLKKAEEMPFFGLSREGLVVDDKTLLSAQDPDGNGEWIPVAWNHLTASGKRALVSLEKLGRLKQKVESDFVRLASRLKAGQVETNPLYSAAKKIDPCLYCDHLPICKRTPECRRAYRTSVTEEEIFGKEEM